MTRHLFWTLAAVAAAAGPAAAQYPATFNPSGGYTGAVFGPNMGTPVSPPLSPYLNILGGGRNPAVNYFNFTRPALQAQQQFQQMQAGGGPLAAPLGEPFGVASGDVLYAPPGQDPTTRLPTPTGHVATFGNYAGYYNSLGTIGVPFARPAAQQTGRPGPRR
jgi:hypothetical protein